MARMLWLVLGVLAAMPAVAQENFCIVGVGCRYERWSAGDLAQFDCNRLWTYRNMIYKANGYCFQTVRARRAFGNEGCEYDEITGVPMTPIERTNVATVQRVERSLGCPR